MKVTRMPGFTADTSLYKTSEVYLSLANQRQTSGGQGVVAQLRPDGRFGRSGLGFHLPSLCELECAAVAAACLAAAVAIENPGIALACAKAEIDCLNDCNS
jgi:hypothetical protein